MSKDNRGYVYKTVFSDDSFYIGKRLFRQDQKSNQIYYGSYNKERIRLLGLVPMRKDILGIYDNKSDL